MNNVRKDDGKNNLALYLKELKGVPMLTRAEEEATARAASRGDTAAREKLVSANLRFVINVAKNYQGLGLPLEDLIGEGNLGLLTAVDRFDVDKGFHFISYAVWWIRQAIISAIYEKARMIRLPANRAAELIKIRQAKKIIRKHHSPDEEAREIAKMLDMDNTRVQNLIDISREIISLDRPMAENGDWLLKDTIADNRYGSPDSDVEREFMKEDIEKILNTIESDEADIIRCHYGLGCRQMSLKEIGARYNLSKERVRQIEEKALSRLKNPIRSKKLEAYVA